MQSIKKIHQFANSITQTMQTLNKLLEGKKGQLPQSLVTNTEALTHKAGEFFKKIPTTKELEAFKPMFHVIGETSNYKTSMILDLYNNQELRKLIGISGKGEHTAVPCMIKPTNTNVLVINKIEINAQEKDPKQPIKKEDFLSLYKVDDDIENRVYDYYLEVQLPKDKVSFSETILEYPGLQPVGSMGEEDSIKKIKERQKTSTKSMMQLIEKYPGVLIACFNKPNLSKGSPVTTIFTNYKKNLQKFSTNRIPLLISFTGDLVVNFIDGSDDFEKEIKNQFQQLVNSFNLTVLFSNPLHKKHPLNFVKRENSNYLWVKTNTAYQDVDDIISKMQDGGFEFIRSYLMQLIRDETLREIVILFYKQPLIDKLSEINQALEKAVKKIGNYDFFVEFHQKIQHSLTQDTCYQTIAELKTDEENNTKAWYQVIEKYLDQFVNHKLNGSKVNQWLENYCAEIGGQPNEKEWELPYSSGKQSFIEVFKVLLSLKITNMINRKDPIIGTFFNRQQD